MAGKYKSEQVANLMKAFIDGGNAKKAAEKCDASYQFNITDKKDGQPVFFFWATLKKSGQASGIGKVEKPDATFTMTDSDFYDMCLGKLNPQMAFVKKQMKIGGNFKKASIFTPDLFPKPTPENIAKYSTGTVKL